jgi:hypothetical protein
VIHTFTYTGAAQTWTVPNGVTSVQVAAYGAQGTNALGGVVGAMLAVKPGETLYVYVGGAGKTSTGPNSISGGFNGGANGGALFSGVSGGGGGGASDVRVGGDSLSNRVIVAGGGGGSSGGGWIGGVGGNLTGGDGDACCVGVFGQGGTQTAGGRAAGSGNASDGSLGEGGSGGYTTSAGGLSHLGGGGGGGGYYGGGGGDGSQRESDGSDLYDGGGGGGSSYADRTVTSYAVGDKGAHYGDGLVTISWAQTEKSIAKNLDKPIAIAADSSGNVYVADAHSYIDMYSPDGSGPTQVGSGFKHVIAVAVDATKPQPNVYVLANAKYKLQVYEVKPPFDSKTHGTVVATNYISYAPNLLAIALDRTYFYFVENNNGQYEHYLTFDAFHGTSTQLDFPGVITSVSAAASCTSQCTLYITDNEYTGSHRGWNLWRIAPVPHENAEFTRTKVANGNYLTNMTASAMDAGFTAYVADSKDNVVTKAPIGRPSSFVGWGWSTPIGVAVPTGCTAECDVYVLDNLGITKVTGLDQ